MILIGITPAARADAGPKSLVKINSSNMPEGEVYLDLLIDDTPGENNRAAAEEENSGAQTLVTFFAMAGFCICFCLLKAGMDTAAWGSKL